MINFYPPNGAESFGYNPREHAGPEQNLFDQAYKKHLRENMSFQHGLVERIERRLEALAKKFYNKKSHDVTYVAIHIRRTDFLTFGKRYLGVKPLNSEYYNYAMEYFQ